VAHLLGLPYGKPNLSLKAVTQISGHLTLLIQVITPPIAGLMVDLLDPLSDSFNVSHLGYKSIFFLASLLLLLAVVFVRRIQITAKVFPFCQEEYPPHRMIMMFLSAGTATGGIKWNC